MSSDYPPARPRTRPAQPTEAAPENLAVVPEAAELTMRDVSSYAVPENVRSLEDIQDKIFHELNPSTHLGGVFAEEIATLTWEIEMYRKAKAAVLRMTMINNLEVGLPTQNLGMSLSPTDGTPADVRREQLGHFLRGRIEQADVSGLEGRVVRRAEHEIEAIAASILQLAEIDALVGKAEYRRVVAFAQFQRYEGRQHTPGELQRVAT